MTMTQQPKLLFWNTLADPPEGYQAQAQWSRHCWGCKVRGGQRMPAFQRDFLGWLPLLEAPLLCIPLLGWRSRRDALGTWSEWQLHQCYIALIHGKASLRHIHGSAQMRSIRR